MKNTFKVFRKIAFIEGISYLVLLLIAMPLKYWASFPMAVTLVGGLHGVLFVLYIGLSWDVKIRYRKSFAWLVIAFIVSLIPFGTFFMEPTWKKEEREHHYL